MVDLSQLNPEQRRAAETTEGALLVLAGAGSGKTRVVVHRIAHLVDRGVDPESILAVTFTNKAAAEMRERVEALTRRSVAEKLTVSTFHAFGVRVLRDHIHRLGYRKRFAIFDTQDQVQLVKQQLVRLKMADHSFDVRRLLAIIGLAKNAGIGPARFAEGAREDDPYGVVVSELYPRYQRALKAMGAVDFDDLIALPLRLLQENDEVREALHGRYRYFLVDEYQDTSHQQVALLEALAHSGNVCAVGDDDQSIYAWRGAEVGNILEFERTFPGAVEVKLTRNYRSTGNVLDCANAVIARNEARRGKDLWTEAGAGEPVTIVTAPDEDEEALWVVEEIDRLAHEERRRHDDFAILFRTNGQSRAFEEHLRARGIEHQVVGGMRFFDRKEVRDGLSYLRAALNPRDDVSVSRIVNYPSRGIGDTTLERLGAEAQRRRVPLWNGLQAVREVDGCERAAEAVLDFVDLLERHQKRLRRTSGLADAAHALFEESGLYRATSQSVKSRTAADAKVANLAALVQSIAGFEEREARPTLAAYLMRVALDTREEDADREPPRGRVTLMTLHAAKGLEFPVVFLAGLEEGLLPHEGMGGEPPNLPEERRLAYVGITRARERLYLTRAETRARHGKRIERIPSRFLEDLPKAAVREERVEKHSGPLTDEDVEAGAGFFASMRAMLDEAGQS